MRALSSNAILESSIAFVSLILIAGLMTLNLMLQINFTYGASDPEYQAIVLQ